MRRATRRRLRHLNTVKPERIPPTTEPEKKPTDLPKSPEMVVCVQTAPPSPPPPPVNTAPPGSTRALSERVGVHFSLIFPSPCRAVRPRSDVHLRLFREVFFSCEASRHRKVKGTWSTCSSRAEKKTNKHTSLWMGGGLWGLAARARRPSTPAETVKHQDEVKGTSLCSWLCSHRWSCSLEVCGGTE